MARSRRSGRNRNIGLLLFLVILAIFFWQRHQRQQQNGSNNTAEETAVTTDTVPRGIDPDSAAFPVDNTEVDDGRTPAGGGERLLPTEIHLYFSNTYQNNPAIGREDGGNIDRHLEAFIRSARTSIDCALFELESERIASSLIAAEERGVRVRIVAEDDFAGNEELKDVENAGIPVVTDQRSGFMHNKFVVVDHEAVWTGSFNATDNGAWRNNNNAVTIRSRELAENYSTEFDEMFTRHEFGPRSTSNTPHTFITLPSCEIYNYFSPEDDVQSKILRFVRAAKKRIMFMAFSFTDDQIAEEMLNRYRSGVTVEGILETRGSGIQGSELQRFRQAGLSVLLDANRYVMHHKVIVIDGTWTILGSYNFTRSAAESNDENVLIIKSPSIAAAFEAEYLRVAAIR